MASTSVYLRTLAGDLKELPRSSMIAAAKAVKAIAEQEGQPVMHPGKRRRAVKLKARDEITTPAGTVTCRVQGVPVGLWSIRSYGTGPYVIPRTGRRRKKPRFIFGGLTHPVLSPPVTIHHPPNSGNGSWDRVAMRAARVVPEIFDDAVGEVLRG